MWGTFMVWGARGSGMAPAVPPVGKEGKAVMEANRVFSQGRESPRKGQAPMRVTTTRRRPIVFHGQVLLIENLRERSQSIRELLAEEQLEVGVIDDARDALELLQGGLFTAGNTEPELVICNARMLGDAGLAALERLGVTHPHVPVLLLSAFTSPKLRERLARIPGAVVLDQFFGLEDVRDAALSLAASRRTVL